jgi:ubiquinone/menaquinone biosynthesis C-methylase UbiE
VGKNALKQSMHDYWNKESCGTKFAMSDPFSIEYFNEIEEHRYRVEPEIHSFAQFTRFRGKKVLEVGVGAGTDFLQWVRSGALAHGIDLTEKGVEHVKRRLALYGLTAQDVKVGDAENIPYGDNEFDLVYSWGVIHHSPNTIRALEEIIRTTKPGGHIKIMIYNRHSLLVYYKWIYYALLKGKPWKSLHWVMFHHQESPGTKAYTLGEVRRILSKYPVRNTQVKATATSYDLLYNRPKLVRRIAYLLACILGMDKCGFYLTIEMDKAS